MTVLDCAAARPLLQAFHDRELTIHDQIAVGGHLAWCDDCAAALADLRTIQAAVIAFGRRSGSGRPVLSNEEAAVFNATVVSRVKAEEAASLLSRLRTMFEDIRLVYAGVGAAAATVVCLTIMLGMMRFATSERPDSLAAIVSLLSAPLECETGADHADVSGCRERWEARFQRANESAEQESVFALDAVVTHPNGRLADLQALRAGRRVGAGQAQVIEGLLDSVSRARLEGVSVVRVPAVTNTMLWVVEHATVRPDKPATLAEPLAPKKRAAFATLPVIENV
jgi:putative zinc finger protein